LAKKQDLPSKIWQTLGHAMPTLRPPLEQRISKTKEYEKCRNRVSCHFESYGMKKYRKVARLVSWLNHRNGKREIDTKDSFQEVGPLVRNPSKSLCNKL
jgi:hypothetical protein